MCVFCAGIPVAASLGAYANSKQKEQAKQAEAEGKVPPRQIIPARPATILVVSGLLVGSLIVHTQLDLPL